jgi:hypothetical protein
MKISSKLRAIWTDVRVETVVGGRRSSKLTAEDKE